MNTTELTRKLIIPAKNRFVTYKGITCEQSMGKDIVLTVTCDEDDTYARDFGNDITVITGYRVVSILLTYPKEGVTLIKYFLK